MEYLNLIANQVFALLFILFQLNYLLINYKEA